MAEKILIVEDSADFREILSFTLRPYRVSAAANGQEGIEKALVEGPDLIVMDLGLPGINGIETTVLLKKNPKTTHIPVVAYTVWGDEFKGRALEAGIEDFLPKTTSPQVLKKVIERLLQKKLYN